MAPGQRRHSVSLPGLWGPRPACPCLPPTPASALRLSQVQHPDISGDCLYFAPQTFAQSTAGSEEEQPGDYKAAVGGQGSPKSSSMEGARRGRPGERKGTRSSSSVSMSRLCTRGSARWLPGQHHSRVPLRTPGPAVAAARSVCCYCGPQKPARQIFSKHNHEAAGLGATGKWMRLRAVRGQQRGKLLRSEAGGQLDRPGLPWLPAGSSQGGVNTGPGSGACCPAGLTASYRPCGGRDPSPRVRAAHTFNPRPRR